MKLASIIVFLTLSVGLSLIGPLHILYKFFTKGVEGVDSLSKPSIKIENLWSKPKYSYAFIIAHSTLVVGSAFWVVYEFTVDYGGITPWIIIMATVSFILFGAVMFWGFRRAQKIRERIPPPDSESSSKEILDWENRYYDEAIYKLGPLLTKTFFVGFALVVLILVMLLIVVFVNH